MDMREVGMRIRRARERKRWTQVQLGEQVGVGVKTINNWENGRHLPRSRIGALEEVLGVNLGSEELAPPRDPWAGFRPVGDSERDIWESSNFSADVKRELLTTLWELQGIPGPYPPRRPRSERGNRSRNVG